MTCTAVGQQLVGSSRLIASAIWLLVLIANVVCSERLQTASRSLRTTVNTTSCSCDYDQVFQRLPSFLQNLKKRDMLDVTFQGPKGETGAEGATGPRGPEGKWGSKGQKGEAGEPGLPGLPGASHVSVRSGPFGSSFLSDMSKGEKGDPGTPGIPGKRGTKGERGDAVGFVIHNGKFTVVKGKKGDRGRRGRQGPPGERGRPGPRGEAGTPGLSIQGAKGNKGEPCELPDISLLQGPPGVRGPSGLPGYPGKTVYCGSCGGNAEELSNDVQSGLHELVNGKMEMLCPSVPSPVVVPDDTVIVEEFKELAEGKMAKVNLPIGTVVFIINSEQLLLRGKTEWKEIPMTTLQEQSVRYEVTPPDEDKNSREK